LIVFYISSHGFGHASRDIEIIRAIIRERSDVRIVIRTLVPKWFFELPEDAAVEVHELEADTGVSQIDSLRLDEQETAQAAARFYATFNARAAAEAAVLRQLGARVVVGDVPPLAFAAAHLAGVPSVLVANFTWDWIYGGFDQFERLAPGVIEVIRLAYANATRALRLPLHGGFETVATLTKNIPLVARRSTHDSDTTRRLLQIESRSTVVLASFGRYGVSLPYGQIAREGRFTLLVTDHEMRTEDYSGSSGLRRVARSDLRERGLRYEDLVAAANVVVSKPGYGIVSECIANDAALLYTSRGAFLEHDIFVREMPQVLRCRFIAQKDLLAGHWADEVEALMRQPPPPARLPLDGADVAAREILSYGM
jgi:L-arabinokinase